MADANAAIREVLQQLVAEGVEGGVQVAAYLNGEKIIETWAGVADPASGRVVDSATLFPIFSAAKVGAITSLHILVDRGLIDYDTRIAEYWPEFAAHGKGEATVRHILTHMVGVPNLPPGVSVEQLCDYDFMVNAVAAMEPVWQPGSKTGYHAQTFHWLAGETIRRISGRMVTDFVREEISRPLGIDFFIGIPDDVLPRIAPAYEPVDSTRPKTEGGVPDLLDRANGLEVWRSIFRGITSAASLARFYAMLGNDGVLDGVRVLKPGRIAIATEVQTEDFDQTLKRAFPKGLGYRVREGVTPSSFGHFGGGGSLGFADRDARFSFGYAKNMHAGAKLSEARQAEARALMPGLSPERGLTPAHYVSFKVREALGIL